jgi:hypothetical protein
VRLEVGDGDRGELGAAQAQGGAGEQERAVAQPAAAGGVDVVDDAGEDCP